MSLVSTIPAGEQTVVKEDWYMSLVTRKPVFGGCDQVRLKPACAATETY